MTRDLLFVMMEMEAAVMHIAGGNSDREVIAAKGMFTCSARTHSHTHTRHTYMHVGDIQICRQKHRLTCTHVHMPTQVYDFLQGYEGSLLHMVNVTE